VGLLDDVENKAIRGVAGGTSNPLASQLLQMIEQQPGGLSGWLQHFQEKGLGGLVSSWVGTGQNLPISAGQIEHVLGSTQVQQLLPRLVDKLTPNGRVPTGSGLMEMGMNLLKSLETPGTGAA
jgi:uncharacterized protein YidB (DUF937 family)